MVTLLGGEALVLALGHSDPGLVSYPTPFMLMATKMAYADVPLPPALHHARRSVGPPPCSALLCSAPHIPALRAGYGAYSPFSWGGLIG